jgi:hypothetical protein
MTSLQTTPCSEVAELEGLGVKVSRKEARRRKALPPVPEEQHEDREEEQSRATPSSKQKQLGTAGVTPAAKASRREKRSCLPVDEEVDATSRQSKKKRK